MSGMSWESVGICRRGSWELCRRSPSVVTERDTDCATIFISADGAADEIQHYEDCRYIGPHEAIWRILHFSMHGLTPNVYWLQLHLKGEHYVYFNPEGGLEAAVHQGRNVRTMLEAFYIVS